jgi:hypothetical protein
MAERRKQARAEPVTRHTAEIDDWGTWGDQPPQTSTSYDDWDAWSGASEDLQELIERDKKPSRLRRIGNALINIYEKLTGKDRKALGSVAVTSTLELPVDTHHVVLQHDAGWDDDWGTWGDEPSEAITSHDDLGSRGRTGQDLQELVESSVIESPITPTDVKRKTYLESASALYDGPGREIAAIATEHAHDKGKVSIDSLNLLREDPEKMDVSPWLDAVPIMFGKDLSEIIQEAKEASPFEMTPEVELAIETYYTEYTLAAVMIEDILASQSSDDIEDERWHALESYGNNGFMKAIADVRIRLINNPNLNQRVTALNELKELSLLLYAEESLPVLSLSPELVKVQREQRNRIVEYTERVCGREPEERTWGMASLETDDIQHDIDARKLKTIGDMRPYDSPLFHNTGLGDMVIEDGGLISSYANAEKYGVRLGQNANEHDLKHSVMPHWSEVPHFRPAQVQMPNYIGHYRTRVRRNGVLYPHSPATFMRAFGEVIQELPISRGALFGIVRVTDTAIRENIPKPWLEDPEVGYTGSFNEPDRHGTRVSSDRAFYPKDQSLAGLTAGKVTMEPADKVSLGVEGVDDVTLPDVSTPQSLRSVMEERLKNSSHLDDFVVPLRVVRRMADGLSYAGYIRHDVKF